MNEESVFALVKVLQAQGEDFTENFQRDVKDHIGEKYIGKESRAAVKELVADEVWTLVKQSLEDILRASYYYAQNGGRSVVYIDVEQVILAL